jgi:hypothetical protein
MPWSTVKVGPVDAGSNEPEIRLFCEIQVTSGPCVLGSLEKVLCSKRGTWHNNKRPRIAFLDFDADNT